MRRMPFFGVPQFEVRYALAQKPLNPSRVQRQDKGGIGVEDAQNQRIAAISAEPPPTKLTKYAMRYLFHVSF